MINTKDLVSSLERRGRQMMIDVPASQIDVLATRCGCNISGYGYWMQSMVEA